MAVHRIHMWISVAAFVAAVVRFHEGEFVGAGAAFAAALYFITLAQYLWEEDE